MRRSLTQGSPLRACAAATIIALGCAGPLQAADPDLQQRLSEAIEAHYRSPGEARALNAAIRETLRDRPDPVIEARTWLNDCESLIEEDNAAAANAARTGLEVLARAGVKGPEDRVPLELCRLWANEYLGSFEETLAGYDAALEEARRSGSPVLEAKALIRRGALLGFVGRLSEGLDDTQRAHRMLVEQGETREAALGLHWLALLRNRLGDYDQAIEYTREVAKDQESRGHVHLLADTVYNLARALDGKGELDEALREFVKARNLWAQHDNATGVAYADQSIGAIHLKQSRPADALVLFDGALVQFRKIGDQDMIARINAFRAGALQQLGRIDEALVPVGEAITIYTAIQNSPALEKVYGLRAELLLATKDFEGAAEAMRRERELHRQLDTKRGDDALARLRAQFDADRKEQQNLLLAAQRKADAAALEGASRLNRLQGVFLWITGGLLLLAAALLVRQRRLSRQIRATEEWYHSIIESAPDGMLVVDGEGNITLANASAATMFGYPRSELVGMRVEKLVPEGVRGAHPALRAGYIAKGGKRQMGRNSLDIRGKRKHGTEFPAEIGLSTLPPREGKGEQVCVVIRDISERKHQERQLARERELLKQVLDNSPVAVAMEGGERLSFVNPEFNRLFGAKTGDPVEKGWASASDREYVITRLRAGKVMRNVEFDTLKVDGEKGHFMATWALVGSDGVDGVIGWVMDISERAAVERMKKEFVSTVSHELRTPLTSIRGSLALLVNGVVGQLPDAAKPLVQIAHSNSERLILLVNDILDMEKLESERMQFDIQEHELMPLVEQAVRANRAYAQQHGVDYEIVETLSAARLRVDSNRLMQVLANLLSNAAKFSPPGERVSLGVIRAGDRVRIEVRDRGPGIPEEFRGRIFQKFAQADSSDTRKKGGTGLGLNITRSMVERMGGKIGFASQPGVLTTFFVEFPLISDGHPKTTEPALEGAAPGTPASGGILVCEDEPDVASLLRLLLQREGIHADIAASAGEAKTLLATGNYRAITVDLDLPDQSAMSLIRELRADATTHDLPVIAVSAHLGEDREKLAGEAFSVAAFVEKPIDESKLSAAMRQALRGGVRPRVLHVEDDADIVTLVRTMTGDIADVISAASLAEANDLLAREHFDLAILDISLPDGEGIRLVPALNSASPPVPVMVFSAQELTHDQVAQQRLKAALLKSRAGNAELLDTIKRLIGDPPPTRQDST